MSEKAYTTEEAAKFCGVAPRTIAKWFDTGRLRGYRVPGTQDRRVPHDSLLRFMNEHGLQTHELEAEESL